jgi:hypothetical protein
VTIRQQIAETCTLRSGIGRQSIIQISGKYTETVLLAGLRRAARLPIYLSLQLRYEKICKSARMMALAGGEF